MGGDKYKSPCNLRMQFTAVDIAILPSEPVRGLAIELSKELNSGNFHLNTTDIFPHITLGIGFVEDVLSIKNYVLRIAAGVKPFEVVADRVEGRYLMCKKSDQIFKLHKAICDGVKFVHLEDLKGVDETYWGADILDSTKDFTNNYKWHNAYRDFVPHITIGWSDDRVKSRGSRVEEGRLPMRFDVKEIFICQLGNHNTCRKIIQRFELGGRKD